MSALHSNMFGPIFSVAAWERLRKEYSSTYTSPVWVDEPHPIDGNELAAINAFLKDSGISTEEMWDALLILKKIKEESE